MGASVNVEEQRPFEELYRRHGRRVVRLCRLLLRHPEEAEDVAQDVLMKLLREQSRRPGVVSDAWLRRVAINACRDRRRSAWSRLWHRDGTLSFEEMPIASRDRSPEQEVLGLELRREIWAAFRRLSARQQEVFALRHIEELTTTEVAATLGITEGSTKRHLFRAVRNLRAALGGAS